MFLSRSNYYNTADGCQKFVKTKTEKSVRLSLRHVENNKFRAKNNTKSVAILSDVGKLTTFFFKMCSDRSDGIKNVGDIRGLFIQPLYRLHSRLDKIVYIYIGNQQSAMSISIQNKVQSYMYVDVQYAIEECLHKHIST